MPAIISIYQVGLAEGGGPGLAREDGLADGGAVTVVSTAHELTAEFALLWVGQHPTPDTTSVETLQFAGDIDGEIGYTFTPTAGVYGSWRIELVTDRGTPAEDRQVRIFAIKSSAGAIRIPAANEQSDPEASLRKRGAAYVARSEFNAPNGIGGSPEEEGTFISHWRPIADLIHAFNEGGGGGDVDSFTSVSANHTILAPGFVFCTNSGTIAVSAPEDDLEDEAANLPVPTLVKVIRTNATVNIQGVGACVVSHSGSTLARVGFAGGCGYLLKTGTNAWYLYGDLFPAA